MVEPAAENDFFGDWGENYQSEECDDAIKWVYEIVESDILSLGTVDEMKALQDIENDSGNDDCGDKAENGKPNVSESRKFG